MSINNLLKHNLIRNNFNLYKRFKHKESHWVGTFYFKQFQPQNVKKNMHF